MHMSPLWDFGRFGVLPFYTHAAPLGLWVGQDARPTDVDLSPVGRDSYLDTKMSILENRPTEISL